MEALFYKSMNLPEFVWEKWKLRYFGSKIDLSQCLFLGSVQFSCDNLSEQYLPKRTKQISSMKLLVNRCRADKLN